MNYLVFLFGSLIVLSSAVVLIKPVAIFNLLKKHASSIWLHLSAVVVRIVLGAVLIAGASESKFTVVFQVLGWLSILAALMLAVIGRVRFQNLINWALELTPLFKSLAGLLGILFGGFLIYSVL
ncbi:hypothetical protein [Kineobactrum salinum]|uniref:Hydrogenase n=1 Tax=Kineobactrum salinum TaxID=2708301 RepID=A0A6C0U563_9GAMM|nr:hypothetical protein [Kineobactrum salinum]QIB67300.1 hypothetical protein G3T16_19765 [Kineobactrum salinum]